MTRICVVSPAVHSHPQYYQTIKYPISLEEVHERVITGHYKDFKAYTADVRLVFRNSAQYNKQKSDIWHDTMYLRKEFNTLAQRARGQVDAIFADDDTEDGGGEENSSGDLGSITTDPMDCDFVQCLYCGDNGVLHACGPAAVCMHCRSGSALPLFCCFVPPSPPPSLVGPWVGMVFADLSTGLCCCCRPWLSSCFHVCLHTTALVASNCTGTRCECQRFHVCVL